MHLSQEASTVRSFYSPRRLTNLGGLLLGSVLASLLASCGGSGGSGGGSITRPLGNAELMAVHHGRLVDVYGIKVIDGLRTIQLAKQDVLIGPDIQDERPSGSRRKDSEVLYDFVGFNPDNLQARLLITREIGSREFTEAMEALDDQARVVAPAQFGRDTSLAPYSVVPRNAALRLTFSRGLGIEDGEGFFVERDARDRVIGLKNTEAIQLLRIKGNPNDNDPTGDFQVVPARISVQGNVVIVDPVLLGQEGLRYGVKNSASGMPEAPNRVGANIRLAVALSGPLHIKGVRDNKVTNLSGTNNAGTPSIIRDFRSGNNGDNSADLSRGFVRDPVPPRLVGQMRMLLERVDAGASGIKRLTIYKNGIEHEIDQGDVIRIVSHGGGGGADAMLEVLADPADDLGRPEVQHVQVLVRAVQQNGKDLLESLDPANLNGYPPGPGPKREEFLRNNAPQAVLVAEYTHERPNPNRPQEFYGDDPAYFLTFSPTPIQDPATRFQPNQDVSPFAGIIVRFSKPVDMRTVRGLDSLFFATRDVITVKANPATSKEEIEEFLTNNNMPLSLASDPAFLAKFRTPHLLFSRVFDENGSQTAIRVQPTLGFYLDERMRQAVNADRKAGKKLADWRYNYYLHLMGGVEGIRDLSGNPLDFRVSKSVVDGIVLPFALDTRKQGNQPRFDDNLSVYVVRRFADPDEDERPSLHLPNERPRANGGMTAASFRREDMFGPVTYLASGELLARTTSRQRQVVDNLNQLAPPPQNSTLRWCPTTINGQMQVINPTASVRFGGALQNPLNPFGCRLQMVWREVDMSLSRTDPDHFNLDVEQMYWAPFTGSSITFDEFDRVSMFLGHSEMRPEPCIAGGSAFPSMPQSGLRTNFSRNYAFNNDQAGRIESQPRPHPAYVDQVLTINSTMAITEPNQVNRFLPLPSFVDATKSGFTDPLFVFRDETVEVQGGVSGISPQAMAGYPYILSPFMAGRGNYVSVTGNNVTFNRGGWYNGLNQDICSGAADAITGGLVGPIGLPLMADFWTYPDSATLPEGNPFRASGANGWQVSLAVTSSAQPSFRAYSAGFGGVGNAPPTLVSPSATPQRWANAAGGFTPRGMRLVPTDNTVYWMMADFLKRTTVATSGFVDILNPHRMPASNNDPRLGPFTPAASMLPDYAVDFEPPLSTLPAGTSVVPEFRGAGVVDSGACFPWRETRAFVGSNLPTPQNFPNDPLKAGDAGIRHWDTRNIGGQSRRTWTYLYNRNLTSYTQDLNDLSDSSFTNRFSGSNEAFEAGDVKYFNWRLVMRNNVAASPPVSPKIESFAVSYRFTKKR